MLYLKWNYVNETDGAMKSMQIFKNRNEFQEWYNENHDNIKNILIPIGSGLKRSDLVITDNIKTTG